VNQAIEQILFIDKEGYQVTLLQDGRTELREFWD
jgi:hypothetical protein